MEIKPLSASSVKLYLQCLLKYRFRYIDKKPREQDKTALSFGIAVHAALEYLYSIVKNFNILPNNEHYEEAYRTFTATAIKEGLSDLKLYEYGREMITVKANGINLAEKVIAVEDRFELRTPKGTPFIGAMDKAIELDPDTLAIIDYKTSKTALTEEEADEDIQASMYDLAASIIYPKYKKIIIVFEYTREGNSVMTHRTREQRKVFVDFLDELYVAMGKITAEEMVPTLNQFCGWCEFKSFCKEYAKATTDPDLKIPRPETLSDNEIVEAFERLQNIARAADTRLDQLKEELFARSGNAQSVKGAKMELYKTQRARVDYDVNKLFKIIPQKDLPNLVSVKTTELSRYVDRNPALREDIERIANKGYGSAYFMVRKKKDKV